MKKNDLITKHYSAHYQHIMPQTREGWEWVLDRIRLNFGDIFSSIPKKSKILDLAYGVGYLEHYLLRKDFTNIYAVDLSREQIDVAVKKLEQFGINYRGKVEFELVDAFEYLRKASGFNVIVMIDLIEHFKESEILEMLRLSHKTLRDGGFLLIRTPNAESPLFGRFYDDFTHETPFTRSSLRQILASLGFQILKVDFERRPYFEADKRFLKWLKRTVRSVGLTILAKFLGMTPAAFSGDIVAVGKK